MKKYCKPFIDEEILIIEDICASSNDDADDADEDIE